VFMTRSLDVMPKTTEHNLTVRSGKSEAAVTNHGGIVLLKLTRQTASTRGLSAIAELVVLLLVQGRRTIHGSP